MSYINKYSNGVVITPSDSVDLVGGPLTAIRCTAAGVVKVNILNGAQGVLMPVSPNNDTFLPITRVLATGTTATGLFGFY